MTRHGAGDDVGYPLARTVRSCLQYNAVIAIGVEGANNECRRGECMKRATAMFEGDERGVIPKLVVKALMLHWVVFDGGAGGGKVW